MDCVSFDGTTTGLQNIFRTRPKGDPGANTHDRVTSARRFPDEKQAQMANSLLRTRTAGCVNTFAVAQLFRISNQ